MKCKKTTSRNRFFTPERFILKYAPRLLVVVLALNISMGYAEGQDPEKSAEAQTLAASVNGVPIELEDLAPQVDMGLQKYRKYGLQKQDDDLLKAMRMQALEKLISVELLYQEASKLKVDDLQQRVEKRLNELKDNSEEDFDEAKIREILNKQILIDEYLARNNLKDSAVPENDIKAYYEKNKEAFKRTETVKTRHVLVSVAEDAKPEEKAAARKKIEEARKLIVDGKPFDEIAKEYSDCNSAQAGGELGYQERGYMPEAFDDLAFSLEKDKLSDVIETKFGFHILEVLDHKSAGIQSYEEVRDFVAKYLNIEHRKKIMNEHLSALRKKAKVDIYL